MIFEEEESVLEEILRTEVKEMLTKVLLKRKIKRNGKKVF